MADGKDTNLMQRHGGHTKPSTNMEVGRHKVRRIWNTKGLFGYDI